MIKRNMDLNDFEGVNVCIPKTLVLCTEIFDQFMENNDLYPIALSEASDETILETFMNSHLPDGFNLNLRAFLSVVRKPIAIRSSSLLEDAHYQPFAGIYSTYMIPFDEDIEKVLLMLKNAIKGVYASVFFQNSKAYMKATSNIIDQEKMAIILEEVCGNSYGNRHYPTISGVALVLHPHPLGGGTMHNKVVFRAAGALNNAGLATLRINFRGVGQSSGEHDEGQGELEDVRASLQYLADNYPGQYITLCGFSFGARVGLEVGISDHRVRNLISLGTPIDKYDFSFLEACRKPLLLIHGDHDEFGELNRLKALVDKLRHNASVELQIIRDCGHFFEGHLDELKEAISDWTRRQSKI